jgi:hypothetical protein
MKFIIVMEITFIALCQSVAITKIDVRTVVIDAHTK